MEKIIYESLPYVYGTAGILGLYINKALNTGKVGAAAGVILICCGVYVYVMRSDYRKGRQQQRF